MTIFNVLTKHFGGRYKNHKGDIGLEIETETLVDYLPPKFSFWDVHADGSLRNVGKEFVLRQPLDFEITFPQALEEFKDKTKGIDFIKDSITTSVHTHLNFLKEDFTVLGNFLTTYALVENILIRYSGEDRRSNLFCLPMCDAEETYRNILSMLEGISKRQYGRMGFEPERTKYGALNLASLTHFGSLEIRSFKGTTDTTEIYNWVGVLYSILKYSRQEGLVPPKIIQIFKEKGTNILADIFGTYREALRHPEEEELLNQNFWYAANIAFSVKNWKGLEDVPKPKIAKPKELDKIAKAVFGGRLFETLAHEEQLHVLAVANGDDGPMAPDEPEWGNHRDLRAAVTAADIRATPDARVRRELYNAGDYVPLTQPAFAPPPPEVWVEPEFRVEDDEEFEP